MGAQVITFTYTREHQQLGRADGASGYDDLVRSASYDALSRLLVLDTIGTNTIETNSPYQGPSFHLQIIPVAGRIHVRPGDPPTACGV